MIDEPQSIINPPTAVTEFANALRQLNDNGTRTPCQTVSKPWWLSEHKAEREAAAFHCARCPLITECRDYADRQMPRTRYGVFGGRDFTEPGI